MPFYIEMPKLSDTMTEGTLVKWLKKVGDPVAVGDAIAEVETDKATMEMEAFDEGTIGEIYVEAGAKALIGAKLAVLLADGETAPAKGGEKPEPTAKALDKEAGSESEAAPVKAETAAVGAPVSSAVPVAEASSGQRVKASPLAKKIAATRGIQIGNLKGTGPGGRVVAQDVQSAPTNGSSVSAPAISPAASAPLAIPPMPAGEGDQRIPLSGMRRTIAERLLASKTQIPHFYLNIEVDAGPLMAFRASANVAAESSGQPKLTVNDFILKAAIVAAVRVPAVNASFAGDAIIQYANVNLSVAVAVDDGLVTPVIRAAQKKTLREISEAVKDLATRARTKKLKPDEYGGGTITVSNLGSYGIDNFFAIVNPPQALILAVGAAVKKPVVNSKGEIVVGQRMAIGLSADHRVVDGAIGAQYLAELRKLIENPALMLL